MADQPCTRCGAPAEPGRNPTCSLCAFHLKAGIEAAAHARGAKGGLEAVMGALNAGAAGVGYWDALELAKNDARVVGKCTLVRPTRHGLTRCLAPVTRETENGDRCCERCWVERGCR